MADIDSLKFSIILDDSKFKDKMKEVETLAEKFEKTVKEALAITNLLDAAQGKVNKTTEKNTKATEKKAKAQADLLKLTREELEAKKKAGTITNQELTRLNALIRHERLLNSEEKQQLDIENKKLTAQKKQLDIQDKQEKMARRAAAAERAKGEAASLTTKELLLQSSIARSLNTIVAQYVSLFGAISLARNLVRITGEFEAQHVALRAILQDTAAADRIFYQLQELAVKSPFTFRGLTDYAKQLSAFSVPINEIYDTTKRLADVSAGLGVDMSRIILAYGQIRSASFLRGQEVRQLTEAGIPVLEELAKQFKEIEGEAISVGKVFDKISARQVPFEMIEKMFKDLTSEGGKFYQMQEVLAETVKGKVSNLQDAWEIMLSKVGEDNDTFIKGVLDGVTKLVKNYKDLASVLGVAAVAYGTYRVAVIAATQAQATQGIVMAATGARINALVALITRLAVFIRSIPSGIAGIVTKLNPWALGIAAVTAAVTALILHQRRLNEHLRKTDELTRKAVADAEASKSSIHYYIQRLKEAKEGTEEYNRARQAVIDNSGNYISATDAERLSLQNVDDVWVSICNHIEEATKLQAMQTVTAEASATKQETQLKIMDKLAKYQQDNNLSNETRQNIAAFIRREITEDELKRRLSGTVSEATGGYYSPGSMSQILYDAGQWWDDYYAADRRFYESINRARQNLNDLTGDFEKNEKKAEVVLDGWRGRVSDYLGTVTGGTRGVKVSEDTNLADLAKNGAEALNDLRAALKVTPETEKDYQKIKNDIAFWEKLSETIYGSGKTEFGNTTKFVKAEKKSADEERREQIAALKQTFQDLKELKNHYDDLKKYGVSDEQINAYLNEFYGRGIPAGGFKAAFDSVAAGLVNLGDENTARDVRNFAAGKSIDTVVNGLKEVKDAAKEYDELMRKWENHDFNLWGTTKTERDMAKIVLDYVTKENEIEDQRVKATELAKKKHKGNADAIKEETDRIDELAQKNKDYEKSLAQDKITGLAKRFYEEHTSDLDMESLSVKTRAELDNLRNKISVAKEETLAAIDEAAVELEKKGFNVNDLKIEVSKNFDDADSKIGQAQTTKNYAQWQKAASAAAKAAGELAEALGKLGEASGNSKLTNIGEAINGNAKAMKSAIDGVKEYGGWWGAIIGALEYVGKELLEDAAIWKQVEMSVRKSNVDSIIEKMDDLLERSEGKLGSSWTVGLRDAVDVMKTMREEAQGVVDALTSQEIEKTFNSSILNPLPLETFLDNLMYKVLGFNANIFSRVNNDWKAYQDAIAKGYSGIESYIVKTQDRSGFLNAIGFSDKYDNLKDLVEGLGYELYDEYGNLNAKGLQAILDTYTKLGAEDREWMESAIKYSEEYEKAVERIKETVSDLFGDMSSTIADNMIESFNATGDAVSNLSAAFDDLGESFVKSMLESAVYETVLKKYEKQVQDLFLDYGKGNMGYTNLLDRVDDLFGNMGADFEKSADVYNAILDRARDMNWISDDTESSTSLGSGIKSITEDTANLLASYINAIRADVSYGKTLWERIAVAAEGGSGTYVTLNEYMAEVAANTFDTAQNTQRILSEMQSVIGPPGTSGMVVRVETY